MVPAGKRPSALTTATREVLEVQNTRDLRAHAAALQRVVLIPSEHSIANIMNAMGQEYAAERASGTEATLL
eukprot:12535123-Heterocapsa_arctica.AAC.1